MQSDEKLLIRLSWVAVLTIVLIGVGVIALRANDITGTVAKVEPLSKPDGTLAHPYADVNQCPPGTDIAMAGRVALDSEHPQRFLSLFCGGTIKK